MTTITVTSQSHSYPIYIGAGLLQQPDCFLPHLAGKQVCIVSNETVAPLYLDTLKAHFESNDCDVCTIVDGESHKTTASWMSILDTLVANKHHRDTTLIALGGGVVGDITGFAAACYQRGVAFIQVPTTLLAQVDSSIGGKTAINHPGGKNLIGAFWQPQAVIIDTDTLSTLPEREYLSGFAEIIKAAIIADADFFTQLSADSQELRQRNPLILSKTIERSCIIKRDIVQADERETTGTRALLNLGHTFAHAIEQYLGYGEWLHGEAVGLGLVLAAELSLNLGEFSEKDCERIRTLVANFDLPTVLPSAIDCAKLCSIMALDKKVQSGQLRMVLPIDMGSAKLTTAVSLVTVQEFLAAKTNGL